MNAEYLKEKEEENNLVLQPKSIYNEDEIEEIEEIEDSNEENDEEDYDYSKLPYILFKVGESEYKLKLTTEASILAERYIKNGSLSGLLNFALSVKDGDIDFTKMPTREQMLRIVHFSMQAYHHKIKYENVVKLYDKYVENGGNDMDLYSDVIVPVLINAGFLPQR